MKKKNYQIIVTVYLLILIILYAIIFSGQVLGFLKLYKPIPCILMVLFVSYLLIKRVLSNDLVPYLKKLFLHHEKAETKIWDIFLYVAGTIIILLLIFPTATWPFSPINDTLTWDAGLYHFPKAIELLTTGSHRGI